MSELKNRVFVYGTLKRGNAYHSFLLDEHNGKAMFVGAAQTVDTYPLIVPSEYKLPFLLCSPGDGKIVDGEVYGVDDAMLISLDDLECHPTFYLRQKIAVDILTSDRHVKVGERLNIWAYLLPGFQDHLLKLPTYSTYNPVICPDQLGVEQFPTYADSEQLEEMRQKLRMFILQQPK